MRANLARYNRRLRRALPIIAGVAVIAFITVSSSVAFGANPAEEMTKAGATGGVDPKGNSCESIQRSVLQFGHPACILRLRLSVGLAVGCAVPIAWQARRASPPASLPQVPASKLLAVRGQGTHGVPALHP